MAVNAPEAGTVKEFLAKEEDTVTVGQDLLKLELGGVPDGGSEQQGGSEPKSPAPDDQSTSSDPKPQKKKVSSTQESVLSSATDDKADPSKEDNRAKIPTKEVPLKDEPPSKSQGPGKSVSAVEKEASSGNRDERRVGFHGSRS